MTTVGVVGANGQVGTEVSLLLDRDPDVEVVGVVRNRMGTQFLRHAGLDTRVADVADPGAADRALDGLDAVVVAAFAWQYSREGFRARGARRTNEALVEHAVRHSPADAPTIYFSSQAAFGDRIGAPQYSDRSLYVREKRNAERTLKATCEALGTPGYALRLGFVHGVNQSRTAELRAALSTGDRVRVVADPGAPSNVLHTPTLADAVLRCVGGDVGSGRYSVVNEPQWTWREVCEHYAPPGTTLAFVPPGEDGLAGRILRTGWNVLEERERTLRSLTVHVPDAVNEFLFDRYLRRQRGAELAALQARTAVDRDAFRFDPVSGPFLPDLPETRGRLDALEAIEGAFDDRWTGTNDGSTGANEGSTGTE